MTLKPIRECPICGSTTGKCRQRIENDTQFLCMTFADVRKGEVVAGYRCTGHTRDGLWAMFALGNHEYTAEQHEQWRRERELRKAKQDAIAEQIRRESLSLKERDMQYRSILNGLKLSPEDRADLKRRGFSELEIELCGYKSVSNYQQLQKRYSHLLPGVAPNGRSLLCSEGYLLPVRNSDGLIVACQVRLKSVADGRYRWLSSRTDSNPNGQSPHIHTKGFSELPLAIHRPEGKPEGIALVEGVGQKPFLASRRLNHVVIGAAGGQWASSPNLFRSELERLAAEVGTSDIKIFPDGGDILNKSVIARWQQVSNLLADWGYSLSFGWWWQTSKSDNDIDELPDHSVIRYIAPNEFFALPNQLIPKEENQSDRTNKIKPDWRIEYEEQRSDRSKFKFTRKPDLEVRAGYLPNFSSKEIRLGIIGLKGDWGIGKSHFVSRLCQEWEGKIIQVAHLNSLLHNTARRYDLMHHHEAKSLALSLTSVPRLAICDVSLAANFEPEHWSKGEQFILILDEVTQVLKSLQTGSNLKGTLRRKARTKLEWLIRNATYILAADRDLDDSTLEYLERVRGEDKSSFIIQHTGKKGTTRKPIKINTNKHKDEVITWLINDVKSGLNCAIACENKSDLLAIESLLKDAGIPEETMLFVHGDNSNDPHIKPLIEAIDIEYTKYQILGYTMSLGTGVSLEKPHFDKVYGFFPGNTLQASDQCQMLFRYRPDCEIVIWVKPTKRTLEIDPTKLLENLKIKTDETNNLISQISEIETLYRQGIMPTARGRITDEDLPFIIHKLEIISRVNASKANPFQTLYDLLISSGFTINIECNDADEPLKTEDGDRHKERKKELKEENDRLIAESELMNDVEFESAVLSIGTLRKAERDRLEKTRLHRDTGLEITQEIVKLQRTKKLVQGTRLLRVLLGDDETAIAYDLVDRQRNPDVADQGFYAAKRRLLLDLGVHELISKLKDGWSYTNNSPELESFGELVRKRKTDVKRLLGFTVSLEKNSKGTFKMSNSQLLASVLNLLCVERVLQDKQRGRFYSLNFEHWQILETVMTHMDKQLHTPTLEGVINKAKAEYQQVESTNQQPTSDELDEWLSEEAIADLAELLAGCETPEMLADLRAIAPAYALKLASRRLTKQKKQTIHHWVTAA